ncbi:MAG: histidine kinase [Clostridiales Family XIII bacterium]|jgi:two-component system sensor histidine kinase YesM|nr:histidine kinase [Clostridiales Family XIII bacterium]
MLGRYLYKNELLAKILGIVIISILSITVLTSVVVYQQAARAYVESYANSNAILLEKFENDYDHLSNNVTNMLNQMDSPIIQNFLTTGLDEPAIRAKIIRDFTTFTGPMAFVYDDIMSNLVLYGINGTSYYHNSGVRQADTLSMLENEIFTEARNSPQQIYYTYSKQGLTKATSSSPGFFFIKKLQDSSGKIYGYASIFIEEERFKTIYASSLDAYINKVFIVDSEDIVVSSNDYGAIRHKLNDKYAHGSNKNEQISSVWLSNFNFRLISAINKDRLASNMDIVQPLILINLIGIIIMSAFAYFVIRNTTKPIYNLIDKIPTISDGDFSGKIEVKGTHEVRELANAYNNMLSNLSDYFDTIINMEKDKRLMEMHALQMQIQPHFIYNTLASIKFLVYQGDVNHAVQAIDSFIQLLRYSLSKGEDVITLEDEVAYLKNYVTVLHFRFGDNIHTNFMLPDSIKDVKIPKMILQPIIENAYLHAFPDQRAGFINVFMLEHEERIRIEILDNGTGFVVGEMNRTEPKGIHYSSIGIHNVQSRLQLLYGELASIEITSVPAQGTSVVVVVPKQ